MNTFLASTGHQFVRSPAFQRATGIVSPYELGESISFYKWNPGAAAEAFSSDYALIPAHPPLTAPVTFIDPDTGLLVTTGGSANYGYAESVSGLNPATPNYYYGTYPFDGPPRISGLPYNLLVAIGLKLGFASVQYTINDLGLNLLVSTPAHAGIFAANAAQVANRACHVSHFVREFVPGSGFRYNAHKSRFKTLFSATAWNGMAYIDTETWTIIPPVSVLNQFSINPQTWCLVPTPDSQLGDFTNRLCFTMHSESPEAWSTRTGLPITG